MGRGAMGTTLTGRAARRAPASRTKLDVSFSASEEEILHYTYGQCHALAWALHEETGWSLAACNWDQPGIPDHIFVVDPDGNCIDIHGKTAKGAHPDAGMKSDWKPVSRSFVEDLQSLGFEAMDLGRATFTARMMLGRDPWI